MARRAAIVTVGSELVQGLRVDTNTREIAHRLTERGFDVSEAVSVGDDVALLADQLRRLVSGHALVIVTGGLGPTHDDITRDAASLALNLPLCEEPRLVEWLRPVALRHKDPLAARQVMVQALVLDGATIIDATTGTAPGLVVEVGDSVLALLPGPPREMRPMLDRVLESYPALHGPPHELGVTGMTESDVQHAVQRVIGQTPGVGFTILAKPGDVRVVLSNQGAGDDGVAEIAADVARVLGDACYSARGYSLPREIVEAAGRTRQTIALAESCTGGLVAAALTDVPGSSAAFVGSAVTYSNQAKIDLLGVPAGLLAQFGAVSSECVEVMASEARALFSADIAVAVSGIAGPGGGSAEKPVGTVWFASAGPAGVASFVRTFPGTSRELVRTRATAVALDALRRQILGLPGSLE